MATSRVRIRKPVSGGGLGILTFAAGLVVAAPIVVAAWFLTERAAALSGLLVAPILLALALSAICQRSRERARR